MLRRVLVATGLIANTCPQPGRTRAKPVQFRAMCGPFRAMISHCLRWDLLIPGLIPDLAWNTASMLSVGVCRHEVGCVALVSAAAVGSVHAADGGTIQGAPTVVQRVGAEW